jgi:hypothetical protein
MRGKMIDLQPLLQQIIERWHADNIPIRPGVDAAKIAMFESRYGIRLPADMREYFATVNGTGDHFDEEFFFRFWPFEDLILVEEHSPEVTAAFPESTGYFFFFDHSIEIFLYAIRLNVSDQSATPIAMVYPGTPRSAQVSR